MDPLTIALAVFGGYQGFKSAQRSHQGLLGTLFSTGLGAYGGYSLGGGISGLMTLKKIPWAVSSESDSQNPYLKSSENQG